MRALARLIDLNLMGSLFRLRDQVDHLKNRVLADVKHKAVNLAFVTGFALAGAVFFLLTLLVGLAALYVYLAPLYGRLIALAGVGGVTAAFACVFLGCAVYNAGHRAPPQPNRSPTHAARPSLDAPSFFKDPAKGAQAAFDTAVDTVRSGPREAVIGTLALAVLLGVVIGRRS